MQTQKEDSKVSRSIKFFMLLLMKPRNYSVSDICTELDIERRTLYRYIKEFNEAGLVILTDKHHVRLETNRRIDEKLSDLLFFTREEAETLYNAIESIETDNELRLSLKEKLASIYGSKAISDKQLRLEKSKNLSRLTRAIEEKRRVILKGYSSPHSNSSKDRYVEPFELSEDRKYLWAFEIESMKNKIFRIGRIESVEVLENEVWLLSRLHKSGFTDAFRIISMSGETTQVRLILGRRAHSLLVEEYPMTQKDITEQGEGRWLYEGEVSSFVGIGRFVLGLLDDITIETPELKQYIIAYILENLYK